MASTTTPKGTTDADLVRAADGTSTYEAAPMVDAAGTSPAAAPIERPIDRPVIDRPVDRPVIDQSIDRPTDRPAYTTTSETGTHPRASATAAPLTDDAIVAAADGSSDYEHSDMATAVDEAQHRADRVK